jgi:hypothetical protein
MKATLLYRIASVLLILFAVGHTIGFLKFKPPTAEGLAVHDAMNKVHFQVRGKNYSYGGFYVGFGLFNSVYLLFSALLAWHLGSLAARNPQAIGAGLTSTRLRWRSPQCWPFVWAGQRGLS